MRDKITKRSVDALPKGELLIDDEIKGFIARRLPSGAVTFGFRYWAAGKRRWLPLGLLGDITADQARAKAERERGKVAAGRDPLSEREAERAAAKTAGANTVDALLDNFVTRHVRKNLRSADEVERVFDVYVRPRIGDKSIYELGRRDIVEMLDAIEDGNGPVMADRTLAHVRKAFNWQAARDDRFNTPVVKGMARTKPAERARKRVLDDQELRDVWQALDIAETPSCYPAYIRALLLTAQRREEVAQMSWQEIDDDIWTIPAERYKTNIANAVPLSPAMLRLLGKPQKRGFLFSTTSGSKPFSGYSKARRPLDKTITALSKADGRKPMPHWTLHDLRRTARSLMSRAGVSADIAERVLGHVIPGVRGVYDRHAYLDEKRDALERLAGQIDRILNPVENIIPLRPERVESA